MFALARMKDPRKGLTRALLLGSAFLSGTPAAADTIKDLTSVQFVGNVPFDTQLSAAKKLGVGGVRIAVRWNDVEQRRGHFEWRTADARAGAVIREGFTPIITLFGSNGLYGKDDVATPRVGPLRGDAVDGYARFAAETVKHFGTIASGHPISYEIWNEPNTKTFWSVPPNPEAYAQAALAACKAIKASSGDARVLGLGMEGTPVKAPYVVPSYGLDIYQEWARRAATPDLMNCVDGVSMHPYRDTPETYLDEEEAFRTFILKHWSRPKAPVVVNSEWGYQVDLKSPTGLQTQARNDVKLLLLGVGMGRRTNIYQIVNGGRDPSQKDQTYGLFDFTGAIKPAGEAIGRIMQLIGDYDPDSVSTMANHSIFVFRAHKRSDPAQKAVVAWTNKDNAVLSAQAMFAAPVRVQRAVDLVSGNEPSATSEAIGVTGSPTVVLGSL